MPTASISTDKIRTDALSAGEHLLLSALRRWILGLRCKDWRHWNFAWNELASALGRERGRAATAALERLVRAICDHPRGVFQHHPPCCAFVGQDELSLLCLVGACQRAELGPALALAERLVSTGRIESLVAAAKELGESLRAAGRALPGRASTSALAVADETWPPALSPLLH